MNMPSLPQLGLFFSLRCVDQLTLKLTFLDHFITWWILKEKLALFLVTQTLSDIRMLLALCLSDLIMTDLFSL